MAAELAARGPRRARHRECDATTDRRDLPT